MRRHGRCFGRPGGISTAADGFNIAQPIHGEIRQERSLTEVFEHLVDAINGAEASETASE